MYGPQSTSTKHPRKVWKVGDLVAARDPIDPMKVWNLAISLFYVALAAHNSPETAVEKHFLQTIYRVK
jgi:hypothetical protein